jgi:Ca2+-binding EF-hand superfamily protein
MDNFYKLVRSFGSKSNPGDLHSIAKLAASKFDDEEIALLQMTWQDLADRSNGRGVDKDTFLQYFPLNGLLGERLFVQFDTKKTGYIDFDEFIIGLSIVCRGSNDDKIHFVFNMYDISHDNTVSKQELTTLLNHIPKSVLYEQYAEGYESATSDIADNESASRRDDDLDEVDQYTNHYLVERAFDECDIDHTGRLTYEEFKMWVERNPAVMDYIDNILPYHGPKDTMPHLDKSEILPRQSSRMIRTQSNADGMSSMGGMAFRTQSNADMASMGGSMHNGMSSRMTSIKTRPASASNATNHNSVFEHQSPLNRAPSPSPSIPSRSSSDADMLSLRDSSASIDDTHFAAEAEVRELLQQALSLTKNDKLKRVLIETMDNMHTPTPVPTLEWGGPRIESYNKEGFLWKKGKALSMWNKRWYLISGNCVYYYLNKTDIRPKGVIFLSGSLIEKIKDGDLALKGYYGFELLHQDLCTGEHHKYVMLLHLPVHCKLMAFIQTRPAHIVL